MAVDIQRDVASTGPPRRRWWESIFVTRDAALRPRGYAMTGQDGIRALDANTAIYGHELSIPANAEIIVLTAEVATIRYGVGFTPTAAYGNPLAAGSSIVLTLTDPDSLRLIAAAAGSGAVAHIQMYRVGGL